MLISLKCLRIEVNRRFSSDYFLRKILQEVTVSQASNFVKYNLNMLFLSRRSANMRRQVEAAQSRKKREIILQ